MRVLGHRHHLRQLFSVRGLSVFLRGSSAQVSRRSFPFYSTPCGGERRGEGGQGIRPSQDLNIFTEVKTTGRLVLRGGNVSSAAA